jgi:sortase (surface protein transpeptidase)
MQLLTRGAYGQLVPPTNTVQAGWYTDSPLPGDTGPAVIGGHVDSYAGPGVFFELRDLQPGNQIMIGEGNAGVLTFVVQRLEEYPKATFPISAVFGPVPGAQLRVVTCGGAFDSQTKHYLSNIVVYATYVSTESGPTP